MGNQDNPANRPLPHQVHSHTEAVVVPPGAGIGAPQLTRNDFESTDALCQRVPPGRVSVVTVGGGCTRPHGKASFATPTTNSTQV